MESKPVLAFDVFKLKELICSTFLDNKKDLMKKGVSENMRAALLQKLANEIVHKGQEQLSAVEKIAKDIKKEHNHGHKHDRSKYPLDYDSSSDYEVRKLTDVLKSLDD